MDDETRESNPSDAVATTLGTKTAVDRGGDAPEQIGRYQIHSRLGAGGMGLVLLATDPVLGRRVAIKVLHGERNASDSARQRLLREAQGMAQLSHDNIIVVHEVGTHGDRVYLAMEYVKGETLARRQVGRDWREILAMYARAGRGLQAAHEAGLVHRDFKPDNVLVGDDGRVRVTDFGLVAASDAGAAATDDDATAGARSNESLLAAKLTVTGAVMGTPRYMAPEQHRGEAVDARADQFAFCVALYEALFGTPPFAGDSYKELTEHVLAGDVRAVPADTPVPAPIRDAILRGLGRDRTMRHASMNELLAALTVPETSATPSAARPRRWPLIAAAAAAVAIAGAIVIVLAVRPSPPAPPASPAPAPPAASQMQLAAPRVVEGAASSLDISQLQPAIQAFDRGTVALAGGEYESAASSFEQAYAAIAIPQITYNVGVSLFLQGKRDGDPAAYTRAVAAYTRYLASDPVAPGLAEHIAAIEREIARLRDAPAAERGPSPEIAGLAAPRVRGFVLLLSEPLGATVYIDDESNGPVGVTPWSGTLSGEHEILIARHGYRTVATKVRGDPERAMVVSAVLVER